MRLTVNCRAKTGKHHPPDETGGVGTLTIVWVLHSPNLFVLLTKNMDALKAIQSRKNKEGSDMGATSRRISTCYASLAACVAAAAAIPQAQAAENKVSTTEQTTLTEIVV